MMSAPCRVPVDPRLAAFDWGDVVHGTSGAPWIWWAVALVVLLLVLLGLMKLVGLWPE